MANLKLQVSILPSEYWQPVILWLYIPLSIWFRASHQYVPVPYLLYLDLCSFTWLLYRITWDCACLCICVYTCALQYTRHHPYCFIFQKEHYLGLALGNDNWWRTHGINCNYNTNIQTNSTLGHVNETMKIDGSGVGGGLEPCVLSYVVSTY